MNQCHSVYRMLTERTGRRNFSYMYLSITFHLTERQRCIQYVFLKLNLPYILCYDYENQISYKYLILKEAWWSTKCQKQFSVNFKICFVKPHVQTIIYLKKKTNPKSLQIRSSLNFKICFVTVSHNL